MKLRIAHLRIARDEDHEVVATMGELHEQALAPLTHGGITVVSLVTDSKGDEVLFEAKAMCSDDDPYNKQFGRKLAMKRLLVQLKAEGYTKEQRREVWNMLGDFRNG